MVMKTKIKMMISAVIMMWIMPVTAQVTTPLPAEEGSGVGLSLSADVVSQYVWRGLECGSASLQPTLGLDYKGFSVSAWGSVGLVDTSDAKELDLTASYTIGGLNLGITDYWFNTPEEPIKRVMCSKPTSVTISVLQPFSGTPTSLVTMG